VPPSARPLLKSGWHLPQRSKVGGTFRSALIEKWVAPSAALGHFAAPARHRCRFRLTARAPLARLSTRRKGRNPFFSVYLRGFGWCRPSSVLGKGHQGRRCRRATRRRLARLVAGRYFDRVPQKVAGDSKLLRPPHPQPFSPAEPGEKGAGQVRSVDKKTRVRRNKRPPVFAAAARITTRRRRFGLCENARPRCLKTSARLV
jgi:hypothetical protein